MLEDYKWDDDTSDDIMIIIPENVTLRLTTNEMIRVINCVEAFEVLAFQNGFTKVEEVDDEFYHDHVRRYIREE
ncbi:MAG: hypothetical protein PHN69_03030 [Candidatus Pacebacteria bacterium]|nr:hypothetical protein [Candidatus Paceibacterota bacterium]